MKFIIPIISISLIYIGNTLYGWSLEGLNDLDWIHQHLSLFGIEIFIASILYFIGFLILSKHIIEIYNNNSSSSSSNNSNHYQQYNLNYSPLQQPKSSSKIKLFNLNSDNNYKALIIVIFIFGFISSLYQVTKDVGATLVNHGQYNLLALSGLLLLYIFNYTFWSIILKYFNLKQIIIGFISTATIFLIYIHFKNIKANKDWSIGLNKKELMFNSNNDGYSNSSNVCSIDSNFIVWPEFLPTESTLWVLTGSTKCTPNENQFSKFDSDSNILYIDCKESEQASYTTSPTFFDDQKRYGIFTSDLEALEKRYQKKKFNYTHPVLLNDETVMAQCGNKTEIHFQNIKNNTSYARAKNFNHPNVNLTSMGSGSDSSNNIKIMKPNERTKPVDILLLMFDALSRAHFHRALPLTSERLQQIQNEGHSRVFQFFRYHSLKPYTDPNTVAMYTGYNIAKYGRYDKQTIPSHIRNRPKFNWKTSPMFYQSFRSDSYITSWVYGLCEDWFQAYLKIDRPIDSIDHEMILPFCSPSLFPLERPFGLFEGPYSIRRRCLGDKYVHEHIFNYINQVWNNYHDVGKIVTATLMDAHESTMNVIKLADKQLDKFIGKDMKSHLNDTVLILVSDHGNHQSPYYTFTKGGKIESALPVLYIILPTWFTTKYPDIEKNLLDNENKLATPFQLYDTIRALSKFPEFGGIDVYDQNNKRNNLGLLGEISNNISCKDLGIPNHFCVCRD